MEGFQLLAALVIGVAALIYLIIRTRVHAFPSLVIAATIVGVIGGMNPPAIAEAIAKGFGNTLASIGIVIGFGIMLGKILEISGAAETMADRFVRIAGKGREHWALMLTGLMVGIPVFADSGYVILAALANSLAKKTGMPRATMNLALAVGLAASHNNIPPTPGPLATAGLFNVDLGMMILTGLLVCIPMLPFMMWYVIYIGKRVKTAELVIPHQEEGRILPGTIASFTPIVLPILLILANTVCMAMKMENEFARIAGFIGHPILAVLTGLLIGLYTLTRKFSMKEVITNMEDSLASAGIIILITGAGGSLGNVLRESGVGNYVAQQITAMNLPAFLLPFSLATLVRIAQGSGTVSMITAASIVAPMMGTLDLHPIVAAFSCTIGAMFFSYFNDSFFWVLVRMNGMSAQDGIRSWSMAITVGWGIGFLCLIVMNLIL